jgi:hypothetical protein
VGSATSVISGAVHGNLFLFANDAAMTRVGTFPPPRPGLNPLSPAPPFWFGFLDATLLSGTPGAIRDSIYLPVDYASNTKIRFDYMARNESFETLGLTLGDRWGVSFPGGAGGSQSLIFHAVPEPSTLGLALLAGLVMAHRRFSYRLATTTHDDILAIA